MKTATIITRLLCSTVLFIAGPVSGAAERELIQILQSSTDVTAKCNACGSLRLVGTERAIPALAALLEQERVGHAARYALEGLATPVADTALRAALSRTSGPLKLGLIDSLGWRRDQAAVPMLTPLLRENDPALVAAAATALGRIADREAGAALSKQRSYPDLNARRAVWDARLSCAELQLQAGQTAGAGRLYRELFHAKVDPVVRTAAWRGWVLSDSSQRVRLVSQALTDPDDSLREAALGVIRELKDKRVIEACLERWDELNAGAQVALLQAHLPFGSITAFCCKKTGTLPRQTLV